jgi:hypothetical protein
VVRLVARHLCTVPHSLSCIQIHIIHPRSSNNVRPWFIHSGDHTISRARAGPWVASFSALQELNMLFYGMRNIMAHGNPHETIQKGALNSDHYQFKFPIPEGVLGRLHPIPGSAVVVELRNLPSDVQNADVATAISQALPKSTLEDGSVLSAHVEVNQLRINSVEVTQAHISLPTPIPPNAYVVNHMVPGGGLHFVYCAPKSDPNYDDRPLQVGDIVDFGHKCKAQRTVQNTVEFSMNYREHGLRVVEIHADGQGIVEMVGIAGGPKFNVAMRHLCVSERRPGAHVVLDFFDAPQGLKNEKHTARRDCAIRAHKARERAQACLRSTVKDIEDIVVRLRQCSILKPYRPTKADVLNAMGAYELVTRVAMMLHAELH